jgi:hypothetical protein
MENPRGYPFISRCLIIGVVIVAVFYLVLVAILFFSTRAPAADPCWEKHTYHVRFDTLGVSRTGWKQLAGDELAAAVRWWNAQIQQTDGEWQTFVVANLPGGGGRLLIGRTADQGCIHAVVPPEQWLRVQLQMLGLPV